MPSVDSMSQSIVNVIRNNDSPYFTFTKSLSGAVVSFTTDIGYLAYDFFDTGNRWINSEEKTRLFFRLKKGVDRKDFAKIMEIVIDFYISQISSHAIQKASALLGKVTGKQIINMAVMNDISSLFAKKIIPRFFVNFGFSVVFSLGGAMSKSVYISRELEREVPRLYWALRKNGDLDLFYFLLIEYAKPFVDAIILKGKDPSAFDKVFIEVLIKLSR